LARYAIEDRSGRTSAHEIGRRFEIADGIVGWGSAPFAAVSHLDNEAIDWRGPHAAQTPGRYAPAGQSGSLTVMPGTYGGDQVGMTDLIPSPTGDVMLWLHAITLEPGARPVALTWALVAKLSTISPSPAANAPPIASGVACTAC
jgi:hypothetical protein